MAGSLAKLACRRYADLSTMCGYLAKSFGRRFRQPGTKCALILSSLAASPATASWEYSSWGMSPDQVVYASHGAVHLIAVQRRLGQTGPNIETRAEGTFTDGRLHLHVSFGFRARDGGLALVSYLVDDAAQNYLLRDRLIRIYGPPHPGGDADLGSGVWRKPGQDVIDLSLSDEGPAFVTQRPSAK